MILFSCHGPARTTLPFRPYSCHQQPAAVDEVARGVLLRAGRDELRELRIDLEEVLAVEVRNPLVLIHVLEASHAEHAIDDRGEVDNPLAMGLDRLQSGLRHRVVVVCVEPPALYSEHLARRSRERELLSLETRLSAERLGEECLGLPVGGEGLVAETEHFSHLLV